MLSILKNLSIKIKTQIVILVAISMVALICLIFMQWSQTNSSILQIKILKDQIHISEQLSILVHEMQKERGMSAGFMASNGKKFVNDLKEQRNLTDNAHKKLAQLIENNKNLPKITYHNYKKGLNLYQKSYK